MMARMKERWREYAEYQLAFSKIMLLNESKKGGNYDVKIGNEGQISFLFCPDKITQILKTNLYWAEQVESLRGNTKGELMIGLKRKKFREMIPIKPLHGQHGLNFWSYAQPWDDDK